MQFNSSHAKDCLYCSEAWHPSRRKLHSQVCTCLQGLRGALNAVLFRTGDQSRDFAVVLATNRPGDLDAAILDRMDESLEFALPGVNERRNILSQYVDQYIVKAGTAEGGAGAGSDVGLWQRFSVSP